MEKLTVEDRVESDHQPLEIVEMEEVEIKRDIRRETVRIQEERKNIVQWNGQ